MIATKEGTTAPPALLRVQNLRVHFRQGGFLRRPRIIHAVDGVSFDVAAGETVGLVGESGSGKTTIGRAIVRLYQPTSGSVEFDGVRLDDLHGGDLRRVRRRMQMVFQDPHSSLNPRMKVGKALSEPLAIHHRGIDRTARVRELLQLVGLSPDAADSYPHQFSGGQLQRIVIARAMAVEPSLIICDEPVSALDVSIQAQVINLLESLQEGFGLAYVFIAHDLSVVRHIAHRVAVMYAGQIVEISDNESLYERPMHPYSLALLSAVPIPSPPLERQRKRIILTGEIPSPAAPPRGCRFHPRCWLWQKLGNPDRCVAEPPVLRQVSEDHLAACHFAEEIDASGFRTATPARIPGPGLRLANHG